MAKKSSHQIKPANECDTNVIDIICIHSMYLSTILVDCQKVIS